MNPIHIEMLSRNGAPARSHTAQHREQDLLRYRGEVGAARRERRLELARVAWRLVMRRRGAVRARPAEPVTTPEVVLR
jgi:hypothetical protein